MSFDLDKAAEMLVRNEYEDPSLSVFNSSSYHSEMPGGAASFPEASLDERLARHHPPQPGTSPMQQHFDPSVHGGPHTRSTRGTPAGYVNPMQQPPTSMMQQQQQQMSHHHRLTRAGSMRDPDPFLSVSASTSAMASSQGMPPQAMSMPPVTRMATRGSPAGSSGGTSNGGQGGSSQSLRQSSGVGSVVASITRMQELPAPEMIDRMLQSHPSCGRVGGPSFEDIRDFYNQTPKNDIAWCCLRIMGAHLQLDPKEKGRVEKIVRLAEEYKAGLKSLKDDRAGSDQIKKLQEMTIKLLKGILGAEWFERIQVAYTGYFLKLVLFEMDKSQRQKGSSTHMKCIALYANLGAALKKASQAMHYKIQSQGLRALQTLVGHQTCEYLWRRVIFLFLFLKEKDMKRKKEASSRSTLQGSSVMQGMPMMGQQEQQHMMGYSQMGAAMYPAYGQQQMQTDPSSISNASKAAGGSTKGQGKGRKRKASDSGAQAGESPTGADAKKPKRTNSKKAGTSAGKGGKDGATRKVSSAKTEAEKERERLEKEREKAAAADKAAQEKERLAQEKEKEKAEKAAERERERAERERVRLAEKEKARLERERVRAERAAEKAAEKERARVERERKMKEAREEREREKAEAAKERERLRLEAAKERERLKTEAAKERAEKVLALAAKSAAAGGKSGGSGKSSGAGRSGGSGAVRKGGAASEDFWDKDLPAIDAIDKVIQNDESIFTTRMKRRIFVQAMKRYGLDLDPSIFETLSEAVELHLGSLLAKATDIMSFRTLPFANSAGVRPTSEPKKAISAIYKREYLEAKAKAEAEKDAIRKAGEKKGQSKKDMDEEIKEKLEKLREEEDNKRLAREANLATMSVLGGADAKWAKWSKGGGSSAANTPKKASQPQNPQPQPMNEDNNSNFGGLPQQSSLLNLLHANGPSEAKVKLTVEDLLLVLKRDWRYKGSKWLMQMEYE